MSTALAKEQNFLPMLFKPSSLTCEQASWLNVKSWGVKDLAQRFESKPEVAIVLSDRQFKDHPVVMMRLENYEKLEKVMRDLTQGEAFVQHSLEALSVQMALVNNLMKEDKTL